MMMARLKCDLTCSGVASVATSKSFGTIPSSRSRTAPPTRYARCPAACSTSHVRSAERDTVARSIPCSEAAIRRGVLRSRGARDSRLCTRLTRRWIIGAASSTHT